MRTLAQRDKTEEKSEIKQVEVPSSAVCWRDTRCYMSNYNTGCRKHLSLVTTFITRRQTYFLFLCQLNDRGTVVRNVSLESLQEFCLSSLQEWPFNCLFWILKPFPLRQVYFSKEIMKSPSPLPNPPPPPSGKRNV